MIDGILVGTLFVLVWVAVLIPPAARGAVSRKEAFESSLRDDGSTAAPPSEAARRRQVLGGLLLATVVSLVLGLLPTFRIMLVVHLLLLNSLLAVVAMVVRERDIRARLATPAVDPAPVAVGALATTAGRSESATLAAWRRAARGTIRSPGSFATPDPGEVGLSA